MTGNFEFDHIAPVYDETRRPPSEEELQALVELLAESRTVLDAGVGTGRFAVPLRDRGFVLIGVDLSLGMMQFARGKGLSNLVRANLLRLPLADGAVDAAFMAHVLQFIPEARQALGELGRVARRQVVVQLPEWFEGGPSEAWRQRRARYREIAAELGYALPERGKRYWHSLEELSAIATPRAVRVVSRPPPLNAPSDERFSRWAAEMIGGGRIPPEVHAEIVRRLRTEFPRDELALARPRSTRFVAWDSAQLAAKPEGLNGGSRSPGPVRSP